MDKQLENIIDEFALNDDIEGMTNCLLNWETHTAFWLICVESRLMAPSTTEEQANALVAVRDKALEDNPELLEQVQSYFGGMGMANDGTLKISDDNFEYTEEEQEIYSALEELEDAVSAYEGDEAMADLNALLKDYELLDRHECIQHAANKLVYIMTLKGHSGAFTDEYIQTEDYKSWYEMYTPHGILKNPDFDFDDLVNVCDLESDIEFIKRKDYYAYSLENGTADGSFEEDLKEYGSHYKYGPRSTDSDIATFEKNTGVIFPEEHKLFLKKIGGLRASIYSHTNVFSLTEWVDSFSYEKEYGRHLKSTGVVDILNFVWENDKEEFEPSDDNWINQEECNQLNADYTAFGFVAVDDNLHLALYFDKAGKFGVIPYDQDDTEQLFECYLRPMLEKSQAKDYSLAQILGALVLPCCSEMSFYDDFDLF